MNLLSRFKKLLVPQATETTDGPPKTNSRYTVRSTHRLTGNQLILHFNSDAELEQYMERFCPTAHTNYIKTDVFRNGLTTRLIEAHVHICANLDWEAEQFAKAAKERGLPAPDVSTYSNESSAFSTVARFA